LNEAELGFSRFSGLSKLPPKSCALSFPTPTMLNMSFEFPCPWCGCDTKVRGSEAASWRFRIPCDLCNRDMIVTWDGGLVVGRAAQTLARSEDDTVKIRIAKAG
jgi:hypothetical protein